MTFRLTKKQELANALLASDATHCMIYGGARSGKTFTLIRALLIRALAKKSRHAILRFRFNHIKASIIYDTLPKVMELCFPGLAEHCKLDKTDWFYLLPNDSEIWFGGLDDKERTEKILGQEYVTLYLNECSQIPWASRTIAITRLAQKVDGLRVKAYYDCNPPSKGHWTYRVFTEGKDPESGQPLRNAENYGLIQINPKDNAENLPQQTLQELENLPAAQRRRFWDGLFSDASETALWSSERLDQQRLLDGTKLPDMVRVVVAIDPSGTSGEEDERSDEVGLVVCGLGKDGKGYVLEDISGRMSPAVWGKAAVSAYDRHGADAIVAEENFGGAMVQEVIRSASTDPERTVGGPVPYRGVRASRGKVVRAEPISTLFEQRKVFMVGVFPELEDQLCAMTTAGYVGSRSPDRADAMIWGLNSLFPGMTRQEQRRAPVAVKLGYSQMKTRRMRA